MAMAMAIAVAVWRGQGRGSKSKKCICDYAIRGPPIVVIYFYFYFLFFLTCFGPFGYGVWLSERSQDLENSQRALAPLLGKRKTVRVGSPPMSQLGGRRCPEDVSYLHEFQLSERASERLTDWLMWGCLPCLAVDPGCQIWFGGSADKTTRLAAGAKLWACATADNCNTASCKASQCVHRGLAY